MIFEDWDPAEDREEDQPERLDARDKLLAHLSMCLILLAGAAMISAVFTLVSERRLDLDLFIGLTLGVFSVWYIAIILKGTKERTTPS